MKLKLYLLTLLLGALTLQSCSDDDHSPTIPSAVKEAFAAKYPSVASPKWELKQGDYEAEFRNGNREVDAWFKADGTWVKTETDYLEALPEAVQAYIAANYPDRVVDDVDWVETPAGDYFEVELEKRGTADIYVNVKEDGELFQ